MAQEGNLQAGLDSRNIDARFSRGIALYNLNRLDEAFAGFDDVIALNNTHADAHMNQSHIHLLRANFSDGLPKHEWRKKITVPRADRTFSKPLWSGAEDISGKKINETLWEIEDSIRDKEAAGQFDNAFIELARSVYKNNDKRAAVKRRINDVLGSKLTEEKSYSSY